MIPMEENTHLVFVCPICQTVEHRYDRTTWDDPCRSCTVETSEAQHGKVTLTRFRRHDGSYVPR